MNHWLTAPVLIPLLGGILQAFMGYAPISLRRTLALATTVLMLVSAIVLLLMANDGSYRIYAFGNWQPPSRSLGLATAHVSQLPRARSEGQL